MADPEKPLTEGQREAIKLAATFQNGIAIGIGATGGYASITAVLLTGDGLLSANSTGAFIGCAAFCMAVYFSADFHWGARQTIARLDGPDAKPPEKEARLFHKRKRTAVGLAVIASVCLVLYTVFMAAHAPR